MAAHSTPDMIVDVLADAGITHLFGLPGGATMELYKALHGRENQIFPVVPRDEQTASCMADMYGKLTGKPGVFAAQGGFAGSTGMFGVIEAHLAHSPMVVLTKITVTEGREQVAQVQEVFYRNGYWDAEEHQFRGFEEVWVRRPGDAHARRSTRPDTP